MAIRSGTQPRSSFPRPGAGETPAPHEPGNGRTLCGPTAFGADAPETDRRSRSLRGSASAVRDERKVFRAKKKTRSMTSAQPSRRWAPSRDASACRSLGSSSSRFALSPPKGTDRRSRPSVCLPVPGVRAAWGRPLRSPYPDEFRGSQYRPANLHRHLIVANVKRHGAQRGTNRKAFLTFRILHQPSREDSVCCGAGFECYRPVTCGCQ